MSDLKVSSQFLSEAANILAHTDNGLKGWKLAEITNNKGRDLNISGLHLTTQGSPNKRTFFIENLTKFTPDVQIEIIIMCCKELNSKDANDLLLKVYNKYPNYANRIIEDETDDILESNNPNYAELIYRANVYKETGNIRAATDSVRLAIELQVKYILKVSSNVERNIDELIKRLDSLGQSKELKNTLRSSLKGFLDYNNEHVKHANSINELEFMFVFYLGLSIFKYLELIIVKIDSGN